MGAYRLVGAALVDFFSEPWTIFVCDVCVCVGFCYVVVVRLLVIALLRVVRGRRGTADRYFG